MQLILIKFSDQELITYRFSSCCSSCLANFSKKSQRLRRFKSDRDEILRDCSLIDIWRSQFPISFKMTAMPSAHRLLLHTQQRPPGCSLAYRARVMSVARCIRCSSWSYYTHSYNAVQLHKPCRPTEDWSVCLYFPYAWRMNKSTHNQTIQNYNRGKKLHVHTCKQYTYTNTRISGFCLRIRNNRRT